MTEVLLTKKEQAVVADICSNVTKLSKDMRQEVKGYVKAIATMEAARNEKRKNIN